MEVYLGMALSGTPMDWHLDFERLVRATIASIPKVSVVTEFQGTTGDSSSVYLTDITLASKADLMIALTRYPSIGLGMELQARVTLGKPTLILHPDDAPISRMLIGAPHVDVRYYNVGYGANSDVTEIQSRVAHYIQQMV
jgi:hypothetical protein